METLHKIIKKTVLGLGRIPGHEMPHQKKYEGNRTYVDHIFEISIKELTRAVNAVCNRFENSRNYFLQNLFLLL